MSSLPPLQQPPQPEPPYGPPQAYGYGYPVPQPTNVLAIIALVLSLMGMSIGGVITGHISLAQIRRTAEQGRGMALAGLIIGYIGCAFWLLALVFVIVFPLIMWASIGAVSSGIDYSAS